MRVVLCMVLSVAMAVTAHAADKAQATSVMRLMFLVTGARSTAEYCRQQAGDQDARAVRTWLAGYGIEDVDVRLKAYAGDGYDVLQQSLTDYAAQFRQRLEGAADAARVCAELPRALHQPAMDLAQREPMGLAALNGGTVQAAPSAAASNSLQVPPGQGIAANAIDGVYLLKTFSVGVGGSRWPRFEPFLLLKDGSAYADPKWAPDSLNVPLSQQREAQRWGRWTRDGGDIALQMPRVAAQTLQGDQRIARASTGTSLEGSYKHVGGGGTVATGGGTSFMRIDHLQFYADGRFTGGSSSGLISANTGVASSSQSPSGRYKVDGYAIDLVYDSGGSARLFFYSDGRKLLHIGDADYVPEQ
jgi:hypothetical protein